MIVLGINAFHAEASAALVRDGELLAAAEEERFVRIKHVAGLPAQAIRFCLKQANLEPQAIDAIAISRNPWTHLWAKGLHLVRRGFRFPNLQDRISVVGQLRELRTLLAETLGVEAHRIRAKVHFVEHHRAHIASSFYPSGWDRSVILSLDGFGDFLSGMWGVGEGSRLGIDGEAPFPHSLGILYTALTQFLGFNSWGDEYKVMGLAAYGEPSHFRKAFEELVQIFPRNGYRLGLPYFQHHNTHVQMTWIQGPPTLGPLYSQRMEKLLGTPRAPQDPVEKRHCDIACALQERLEQVVLGMLNQLSRRYRLSRLCYAGGVALNCALNGKILKQTPFREIFIQPAAHDAGTSLGAALYVTHAVLGLPRRFVMKHAAWGPACLEEECRQALEKKRFSFRPLKETELCQTVAQALADGKIVGWYQGRMEFGPRALGHRSLLADPRDPQMKETINRRIKRRESFRPFAPSLPWEAVGEFFPQGHPDPFMLFAYPVSPTYAQKIPAVIHADATGRLQAVDGEVEPLYWKLLKTFQGITGIPVLLNTSFNEQEPIVCRPEEAIACVERNSIDCLALGPYWVDRKRG